MLKKLALAALLCTMTLPAANQIYELRTYTTVEGRLDALIARFRDHTARLFEKHGMTNVGYWVPRDKPNTLVYILSYKDANAAKESWDQFRSDPEWVKAKTESEASGKIVDKVESVFMNPTDFSKLK
jgi:hypothetical protein